MDIPHLHLHMQTLVLDSQPHTQALGISHIKAQPGRASLTPKKKTLASSDVPTALSTAVSRSLFANPEACADYGWPEFGQTTTPHNLVGKLAHVIYFAVPMLDYVVGSEGDNNIS